MQQVVVVQAMKKDKNSAQTTFLGALWIGVLSTVPVYRLIMTDVSPTYVYFVLALIVTCALLGRVSKPAFPHLWLAVLLVIPLASLISGTTTSVAASAIVGIKLALLVGLAPFVFRYLVTHELHFLRRACVGFLLVQTSSAAAGLIQAGGVTILGREANSGRANGLAVHPNVLGVMCALAIVICLAALPLMRGWPRFLLVASAAINVAGLVATGSLSSLLAAGVGVTVLLVCMRITLRAAFIGIVGTTVVLSGLSMLGYDWTLVTSGIEERVDVVTGISDGVASLDIREQTYKFALQSILDDPITGVGMDGANQATYDGRTVVHNYILRGWYQGGFLMFATILAFSVAMLIIVFQSMRKSDHGIAAASIATMLTFAATSAFYDQQQYWIPLLVAVATVTPSIYPTHTSNLPVSRRDSDPRRDTKRYRVESD